MYREKDENAPWMDIRADLLKLDYDVTTKCLHNKFHRKQRGKESQILLMYKKNLTNEIPNNTKNEDQNSKYIKNEKFSQSNDLDKEIDCSNVSPEQQIPRPEDNHQKFQESSVVNCDLTEFHRMACYEFQAGIKHICPFPFHLLYWNHEQVFLWSKFLTGHNYPVVLTILDNIPQKFKISNSYTS